jgi:transcription elongation factor Elf1
VVGEKHRAFCGHCGAVTNLAVEQESRSRVATWSCWQCGAPCEQQLPAAGGRVRVIPDDLDEVETPFERWTSGR